jgi:hypothetical protein
MRIDDIIGISWNYSGNIMGIQWTCGNISWEMIDDIIG